MAQVTQELRVAGNVTLAKQEGIVITNVSLDSKSSNETYEINNYNKSLLNLDLSLENNQSSYLTLAVTVTNTTTDNYIWFELLFKYKHCTRNTN